MARRWDGNMSGERFLGNTAKLEVHDLDQQDIAPSGCQIEEIIAVGNDEPFNFLQEAHAEGYDNCARCLGGSKR